MKISIDKRSYAKGVLPWCPYVGGFWFNFKHGLTSLCWFGYRININRKDYFYN